MAQFGHEIVQCTTDLEHLYRIYSNPTHDKHQWLLLQFIVLLMMDAKGVRNMYSRRRQPTARVPSVARGTIFNGPLSELKYSNYDLIKN